MAKTFLIGNARYVGGGQGVVDLTKDGELVLAGVPYMEAYNRVLDHGNPNDTLSEEGFEVEGPQTVLDLQVIEIFLPWVIETRIVRIRKEG